MRVGGGRIGAREPLHRAPGRGAVARVDGDDAAEPTFGRSGAIARIGNDNAPERNDRRPVRRAGQCVGRTPSAASSTPGTARAARKSFTASSDERLTGRVQTR